MRSEAEIHADAERRRPFSNHTEYEIWAGSGRGCYDCRHDKPDIEKWCPILSAALLSLWPKEWEHETEKWEIGGKSGSIQVVGECSEFEHDDGDGDDDPEPDPAPEPVAELDGQVDMFEVFADRIAEQPHRESVSA
jgi:hypothetical protein